MKTISLFGVTGSVGRSALDVIAAHPDRFAVSALIAGTKVAELAAAARRVSAQKAIIADAALYPALKDALSGSGIEAAGGNDAVLGAARETVDLSIAAIVGMAGLPSLMASFGHARAVAIANKEPLVSAGPFVMQRARETGTAILPVDSEHNALFQVYQASHRQALTRMVLTASGGPFRGYARAQLEKVTLEDALKHPTWSMGPKITVDSATMMNKGLEIIEAAELFSLPERMIDVMIHPQSVVHGMVEYADGSVLTQMGPADMRTPIAHALAWPDRIATPGLRLDNAALKNLTFEPADETLYPALALARRAHRAGLPARIALNAANEIAVQAFRDGKIGFTAIFDLLAETLDAPYLDNRSVHSWQDAHEFDLFVRERLLQSPLRKVG